MSGEKESTYTVRLEDETSGAATSAASALERLRSKIDADTKSLREMQKAQRNLKGATGENTEAQKALKDRIAAQKATIAAAQSEYLKLGGGFDSAAKGAKALEGIQWSAIASGAAAIGAAFVAMVTSIAAATAALLKYGVAQADARRAELLHIQGLTTIWRWYGQAGGNAAEMQQQIDRVSSSVAVGRGEVARYAEQLHRAGLRGQDLGDALQLVGTVATVQGDAQAKRWAHLAVATARYGGSVQDLAATMDQQLGPIARRRMLEWDVQVQHLHQNLSMLFSGLRIEGFLQKIHELFSLFSQSTASGRALKAILEVMLQPLIDGLGNGVPLAKRFFQGMIIGALVLAIGILKLRNGFRDVFGNPEWLRNVDMLKLALYAGIFVVGGLVGAFVGLGAAMAFVGVSALLIMAPFLLTAAAIGALFYAGYKLVGWLSDTDWGKLGSNIIDGLVNGIKSGLSKVGDALRSVATMAQDALTSALGIHSPSRVFAELGVEIPRGLAAGVDRGASAPQASVDNMVNVPDMVSSSSSSSSRSITIENLVVNGASGDAQNIASEIRDALAELLEGAAIHMGAPG